MEVRLLGTAAGGAFPQWDCRCDNCTSARTAPGLARPRSQTCVALSADTRRWFLLNASPDVRTQIESFRPLWPPPERVRGTPIAGVLLSSADLDSTLGLFSLREHGPMIAHANPAIRDSLSRGLGIDAILSCYGGLEWREPPLDLSPLRYADGSPSGILYSTFPVPGKAPRYRPSDDDSLLHVSGYRFVDEATGGRMVFVPSFAEFEERLSVAAANCDLLLLDGTFFDEDEMRKVGAGAATAGEMGHLPVGGAGGSLARIAPLSNVTRVYIHINNTNPILVENSAERQLVEAAGIQVGEDGMHFSL